MTDLLLVLPDFPTKSYTHLIPSLEKNLVTTTDLLTLDALEVAKKAQLPLLDLRRLANHVIASLHAELGLNTGSAAAQSDVRMAENEGKVSLSPSRKILTEPWVYISTLDPTLDAILGGGIPPGYLTEIVGESGAGKTQVLLCLLLASQLPRPHGLSRSALYISTEAPLPTSRLKQILAAHPVFRSHEAPPTLSKILGIQTPDLESQEHIITYQLPIAIARHDVGLVVIDSIAANYRAERSGSSAPAALAERSRHLSRLGAQLQELARRFNCAIVVSNQVADRFAPVPPMPPSSASRLEIATSSSPQPPSSVPQQVRSFNPLTLDHQLRFFSGWGSHPHPNLSHHNLKSPSLGLVWANQLACRLVLLKEASFAQAIGGSQFRAELGGARADWTSVKWKRWLKVAFAAWADATEGADDGVEFEIWAGGVRSVKLVDEGPAEI